MKIRICIITTLIFAFLITQAQIDTILWQTCLGTEEGQNWTYAVEKTINGYLFGIGLKKDGPGVSNFHGIADAWIVQTDFNGNVLWERCYGGSAGDGPKKIIKLNDSTFYLLNSSWSKDGDVQNGRDGNFWIVKINDTGEILWENSYGGSVIGEEVRDAILMPDDGLLMMGRISSIGGDITVHYGDMDIWLCRIDSTGNILWQKTFGNHGRENAIKIKPTSRNSILMIGCHDAAGGMIDCSDPGSWQANVWIIDIDIKGGDILNQWCYGGSKWDQGWDIIEIDDGYVFAAVTNSNDGDVSGLHGYEWTDYYDIWVVKLDENGELLWEHCFGGAATERFWGIHCVYKNDDYNYVLAANAQYLDQDVQCDLFPNSLEYNAWLIEIKDCSFYLPLAPILTSGPDILCSTTNPVALYSIDTVQYATGYEWLLEPEEAGTLLSLDTLAEITWNPQFEGQAVVRARSRNDCGNSGWSEPKYTMVYPCMGIEDGRTVGRYEGEEVGVRVWPNPAREVLSVKVLGLSEGLVYSLEIYDVFGRKAPGHLASLPPGGGRAGDGGWTVDVSGLVPGIYLAVVKDSGSVLGTGKFIIIR